MSEFIVGALLAWFVSLSFLVTAVVALSWIPQLIRQLRTMGTFLVVGITLCIVVGALARFTLVPNVHRVNLDEDRYLSYAVSFARFGKAVSLELASPEQSVIGKPDMAVRLTVPVLNGWIMRLVGYNEHILFTSAKIISTASIGLTAILAWLMFGKRKRKVIFPTLAMAIMPLPLYWSPSISLDPYFMTCAIMAAIATIVHARIHTKRSAVFLASVIFTLLCVRLEAFAFLPVLCMFFYESLPKKTGISRFKNELFLISLLIPLIAIRAAASISVLGQKWCCADALPLEAFDLRYVVRNFLPNMLFFITSREFPVTIGLASFAAMFRARHVYTRSLTVWFVTFFFLYSAYYAGKLLTGEFSGSYGRYFLVIMPAALLLAASWYDELFDSITTHRSLRIGVITAVFIGGCIPMILSYRSMVWNARGGYEAVDASSVQSHRYTEHFLIEGTPENAIIVTNITALPLLHHKTSVYYPYFFENDQVIRYVADRLKNGSRVFMIDYYECVVKPDYCRKIEKYFSYKPYKLRKKDPLNVPIVEVVLDTAPKTVKR